MTQLCIVSQQWDLPSNRFSLPATTTESKAEVVIVSMSIVTAWHDLDDATEDYSPAAWHSKLFLALKT